MAGSVEAGGSAPQRRAYERMTADQFVWWLRGYLDASVVEKAPLAFGDVKVIRDAIDRVGLPARPPTPSPLDKADAGTCWRCGRPSSLSRAHFCDGVLTNG